MLKVKKLRFKENMAQRAVRRFKEVLSSNVDWEIDFLDAKFLNDKAEDYRKILKLEIKAYRNWEAMYKRQRDVRCIYYNKFEGELRLKRVSETLEIYKKVKAEARFLTNVYIEQCSKR